MDPVDVASSKENIGLLFKQKQEERRGQVPVSGAAAIHDQFVANFSDLTTRRERSQKDWQRNVSTTNKLHLRVPCLVV